MRTILVATLGAALAFAGCASSGESGGGSPKAEAAAPEPWAGSGFSVWDVDGRWWVFREGSKERADFVKGGEPAKSVTRVGAGPGGITLKGPDAETLDAFAAWKPGFSIRTKDGRTWVFREGAKELAEFDKGGEPAKSVTRVGDGPGGTTLRALDAETLDAWAAAK